jgi:hypothetical protein
VIVGSVSVAIEKVAEEIAREAMADATFRRTIREVVRVRSQELLDRLLRNGTPRRKRPERTRRRSRRASAAPRSGR